MKMHKTFHPKDDIDRVLVSGKRGSETAKIEDCLDVSIQGTKEYIKRSQENLIYKNEKKNNCMDTSNDKLP